MDALVAFFLGIIEGLTEFLPVSSTGHLIIAGRWLTFSDPAFENMFNIVIQFGAILAVVFYFWNDIFPFTREAAKNRRIWKLWGLIVIAFLPAAVIGVCIDDWMEAHLFNPISVAIALITGAVLIFIAEARADRRQPDKLRQSDAGQPLTEPSQITVPLALAVGLFQCLAMWPGMSRSASTIIGAVFCGFARPLAAEFSFLLGIPTIMGASFFKLLKAGFDFSAYQWVILTLGTIVSFITALVVVKFFMGYLKKYSLRPFAIYRILLGIAVLIFCH
jgi:undecaprenyl-diphosphatase